MELVAIRIVVAVGVVIVSIVIVALAPVAASVGVVHSAMRPAGVATVTNATNTADAGHTTNTQAAGKVSGGPKPPAKCPPPKPTGKMRASEAAMTPTTMTTAPMAAAVARECAG